MDYSDITSLRAEFVSAEVPPKKLTPRGIIFALMPEILAKRESGMSLKRIQEWFAEKGIKTSTGVISVYIADYRRTNKQHKKAVSRKKINHVEAPAHMPPVREFKNPLRTEGGKSKVDTSIGFVPMSADL